MREILTEAQIYRNLYQTELTEEVEIATEYLYSEGINEFGIDLLIDELGIDAFAEFVYDIAEQYELTEARRSGSIEPVTKGGKSVASLKGGAKTAAITRLRKQKESERSGEGSASGSSGMTAALRSQSEKAVKKAAATQKPTRAETPGQAKQGIASRIGAALKYAGERAKKDTEMLKKSYQTARAVGKEHEKKVASAAGTVAGAVHGAAKVAHRAGQEFAKSGAGQKLKAGLEKTGKATAAAAGAGAGSLASGKTPAAAAGKAAGTFVRKMRSEGYDDFDIILEYLISEDFAETNESALAIMANMSEEWRESILDEAYVDYKKGKLPSGRTPQQAAQGRADLINAKIAANKPDAPHWSRQDSQNRVTKQMGELTAGNPVSRAVRQTLGNMLPGGEPSTRRHRDAMDRRKATADVAAAEKKSRG